MRQIKYGFFALLLMAASLLAADITQELQGFQQIDCQIRACSCQRVRTEHELGAKDQGTYPHIPLAESTSLNWSGYAALTSLSKPANDVVTNVSGRWTVPTLSSTSGHTYSSIWIGIDGYASNTVEQIGTEHDWSNGKQQNYAWFEMYPSGSYEIVGFPVNVNDQIGAQVNYQGNNIFLLTLINYTHNVYTTVPTSYTRSTTAKRSSAEWIVEAPSLNGVLPLADFRVDSLTNCTATINGVTGPINSTHWVNDPLTMTTNTGVVKAVPSSLTAGGQSFTVTWKHQ
jgi:hypothetical protein